MSSNFLHFSVIIPTCGRPEALVDCLTALSVIDYPKDRFEIIVVDDQGGVPLGRLIKGFEGKISIRLIAQSRSGPAAARNKGAAQARGRYLAFTDDDCTPSSDWLSAIQKRVSLEEKRAIGGRVINLLDHNLFSLTSQTLVDYLHVYYDSSPKGARFFTSNNLSVPTELFLKCGGFDSRFPFAGAEDRDLCDRWLFNGGEVVFDPSVRTFHAHPLSFSSFLRQHFNYGRGAFYFHKSRRARGHRYNRPEPLRFYRDLVTHPFSEHSVGSRTLVSIMLLASQIVNASGFVWEKARHIRSWFFRRRVCW